MPTPIDDHQDSRPQAPLVGDHLALDLLNTRARSPGGDAVEYWQTGEDVLRWLQQLDLFPASMGTPTGIAHGQLLSEARALRALTRRLVVDRVEAGGSADPAELNAYLHACRSTPHLERDADGHLALTRRGCGEAPLSLLGPVAEAVAELLVHADFSLVKKCGHPECILWFYDRTRAGRRRWCSMALCGNRQKVARFRKRAAAAGRPPAKDGARS